MIETCSDNATAVTPAGNPVSRSITESITMVTFVDIFMIDLFSARTKNEIKHPILDKIYLLDVVV